MWVGGDDDAAAAAACLHFDLIIELCRLENILIRRRGGYIAKEEKNTNIIAAILSTPT